jgi:putative tryptophan/tyrosine transport system substrate-binding protein
VRYYLTLLFVFALSTPAEAQQTKKVPRIGFLSASSPSSMRARVEKFRQGLHELGYVEGQNIAIEYRMQKGS